MGANELMRLHSRRPTVHHYAAMDAATSIPFATAPHVAAEAVAVPLRESVRPRATSSSAFTLRIRRRLRHRRLHFHPCSRVTWEASTDMTCETPTPGLLSILVRTFQLCRPFSMKAVYSPTQAESTASQQSSASSSSIEPT